MPTQLKSNIAKSDSKDLKLALDTIIKKKPLYDLLYRYYNGDHPLRYSTERLKKAFSKLDVYFAENWISVIVNSVLDRMILKGFDVSKNPEVQQMLQELWDELNLSLIANDVHESVAIVSEGYIIAWEEDMEKEGEDNSSELASVLDVYYNDPRTCHVFYDPYRPTQKRFAAKLWIGNDGYARVILYYPNRLEHYKATSPTSRTGQQIMAFSNFALDPEYGTNGTEPNPYGIIPVFHFRTGRTSGKKEIGKSEISLQDAVNKLFADMMVGSEFSTFTQRVIISQTDPGDLKNEAGNNWFVPAGDGKGQSSSVQELGNKSLENYLQAMDHVAQTMAIISRTPKHYLMLNGGDPSGDALLAMEAPLVKKVNKHISGMNPEWKELAAFLLLLRKKPVLPKEIVPSWEPVTSIQPLASAQTIKTEVDAGIPLETAARRQGWDASQIEQLKKDLKEEQRRRTSLSQEELDKLRAEDASSNSNPDGTEQRTTEGVQ